MQRLQHRTLIVALLAALSIGPAMADCPSLPDGPDSNNVTNTQQRALCLQLQLQNSTLDRNTQTQLDNIQTSIDQLQIENRFDALPSITAPAPWQPQKVPGQF